MFRPLALHLGSLADQVEQAMLSPTAPKVLSSEHVCCLVLSESR